MEESDDEDQEEEPPLEVNKAAANPPKPPTSASKVPAQSKVNANHAGNIARVLSSPGKPAKATRSTNTVEFAKDPSYSAFTVQRSPVEDAINNYWANTTQVSYRGVSKKPAGDNAATKQDFRCGDR